MEIVTGETYTIKIRMPWGELLSFTSSLVSRGADGAVTWPAGLGPLEPRLDCVIREEEGWVMGWLGGTCDAVAVISLTEDAPLP